MEPDRILVDIGYDDRFVLLVNRRRLHRYVLVRYQNTDGVPQEVLVLNAHMLLNLVGSIPDSFYDR